MGRCLKALCGGLLPLVLLFLVLRRGSFLEALSGKGEGRMVVTWDAIYKIAQLAVQTGLLVCAILTLHHLKKK